MSATPKDPMYDMAVDLVRKDGRASISYVQRHLRIGYNRAARLIEDMEAAMLVSPMDHAGQRQVYPATQSAAPQPRAVKVTPMEDRSAMVTVEGLCNLPLSESEARALWVELGNHLCEPAGPGLERRATSTPDGGVMRNGGISYPSPAMKARQAVRDGLEMMWRRAHGSTPTDADVKCMARMLKEMAS